MADPTQQRRLAAILATDVVGYTRLMGEDEAGTLARLKGHRAELLDPTIAAHRGRTVKLMGDGALVEFASVVDAVRCAVAIQRAMAERNATVEPGRAIELRIGITLGDIIIEGDDIYGEGVNLAARLEGLARPGGVCISDVAHQMARAGIDLSFEDLGEQQLKNIAVPIRVWHWGVAASGGEAAASDILAMSADPASDRPSIAVLPFDNMSHDPEQEYFSDGLTEDLITDLSQVSGLWVTSRHAVFPYKNRATKPQRVAKELGVRYVLEGSVRRAASRVRINAQLIDAATGYHLWAERYDGGLEDIFALQDEITHAIVSALEVRLTSSDQENIARRYTDNMEAYDLFLRARESHLVRRSKEGAEEARLALERAIELDPNFAAAFAVLGETYRQEWRFDWCADEDLLDRALACAREAVRLDEKLPLAHMLLGWICLWRREFGPAIAAAERSVELDPGNAEALIRLGHILEFSDRPMDGLPLIERAMALDPHHPFIYPFWLGHALQGLQRHEDAIGAFTRSINRNADFVSAHLHAAASYAHLGRLAEARARAAEGLRLCPDFSIQHEVGKLPYKDQARTARLVEGLRKAGLPD